MTPIKVELLPHDSAWAGRALAEAQTLADALGADLLNVHHIGSTSIPGIRAKPTLDLIPVIHSLSAFDARRRDVEALGYEWRGEFGLPGRRYCAKSSPDTGRRLVQLHCYEKGSPEIDRHLAFRDYLRGHSEVAAAYEQEKMRCAHLHCDNSRAYADCKSVWISRTETAALTWWCRLGSGPQP
jgi:GrpB-like predicted nucleotidyltransferase (UPF0157 family)